MGRATMKAEHVEYVGAEPSGNGGGADRPLIDDEDDLTLSDHVVLGRAIRRQRGGIRSWRGR